jgi:hypothetical protein
MTLVAGSVSIDPASAAADGNDFALVLFGGMRSAQELIWSQTGQTPTTAERYRVMNLLAITANNWAAHLVPSLESEYGVGVSGVSATPPLASSGGRVPAISIAAATASDPGSMSAADKAKLDASTAAATASTLCKRDGSAGCAFVVVSATSVALADSAIAAPGSGIAVGSAKQLLVRTANDVKHEASCQDAASGGTSKRIYDRIARLTSSTIAAQDVDLVLAADLPAGSANWAARIRVDYAAYDTTTNDGAGGSRVATIKCVAGTITVLTAAASQIVGTDDDPGSTSIAGAGQFIRTASGKIQFRFTTGKTNDTRLWARCVDCTLIEH